MRRVLKWLMVGLFVVSIGGAGWMGSVYTLGRLGLGSYENDQPGQAANYFGMDRYLAPAQRFVAPFGQGTSLLVAGDTSAAEVSLRLALEHVGQSEQCLVRVNLSLALETQGDQVATTAQNARWLGPADGFTASNTNWLHGNDPPDPLTVIGDSDSPALQLYKQALAVLLEGDCDTRQRPDLETKQIAAQAVERLRQKIEKMQTEQLSQGGGLDQDGGQGHDPILPSDDQQQGEGPTEEQLRKLRERTEQGTEEHFQGQGKDKSFGGGLRGPVDKPW